jgi:hypothetical protein
MEAVVIAIVIATVDQLERAPRAMADPTIPMPARTGGGSVLPMRDLIRTAATASPSGGVRGAQRIPTAAPTPTRCTSVAARPPDGPRTAVTPGD